MIVTRDATVNFLPFRLKMVRKRQVRFYIQYIHSLRSDLCSSKHIYCKSALQMLRILCLQSLGMISWDENLILFLAGNLSSSLP